MIRLGLPVCDNSAFLKLLETRILGATIAAGFILATLPSVLAEPSSLNVHLILVGSVSLQEGLAIQSILTLAFLIVFALIDLCVMHWLAFGRQEWAVFAYRLNSVWAPLPFVLGTGSYLLLLIGRALPALADSLLQRINSFLLLGFAFAIAGAILIEEGFTGRSRNLRSYLPLLLLGLLPYLVIFLMVLVAPVGWHLF
jgi:hypothetical protein